MPYRRSAREDAEALVESDALEAALRSRSRVARLLLGVLAAAAVVGAVVLWLRHPQRRRPRPRPQPLMLRDLGGDPALITPELRALAMTNLTFAHGRVALQEAVLKQRALGTVPVLGTLPSCWALDEGATYQRLDLVRGHEDRLQLTPSWRRLGILRRLLVRADPTLSELGEVIEVDLARSEPAELLLVLEVQERRIVGRALLWEWDRHAVVCAAELDLPAAPGLQGEAGRLAQERLLAAAFEMAEVAALGALRDTQVP